MKIKNIICSEKLSNIKIKKKYNKLLQQILEMEKEEFYLNYFEIKNTSTLKRVSNIFSICALVLTFLGITEFFTIEWKKGIVLFILIVIIAILLGLEIDIERKNYKNKSKKTIYEYIDFLINEQKNEKK